MERTGADLIAHYLDPDQMPVGDRWSREHAHTQRRLCERFAPVIDAITCQDIPTSHTQQIVSAAPTAGEGDRVHGMLSALVAAGIEGRTSPCLQRSRQRVSHPQALTIPQPFPGSAHCISQQATTHARLPARTLQPTLSS